MQSLAVFVEVILPLPLQGTFTYRVPRELHGQAEAGRRVVVQFGKKKLYTGIISQVHDIPPKDYQAKYIDDVLDDASVVLDSQLRFWQWMYPYYMCHLGDVMNAALPSGLKLSSESRLTVHPDYSGETDGLEEDELNILEALQNKTFLTMDDLSTILRRQNVMPIIRSMADRELVVQYEELQEKFKPKHETVYRLSEELKDDAAMQTAFEALKRAPKQLEALMLFLHLLKRSSKDGETLRAETLVADGQTTPDALGNLVKRGFLHKETVEIARLHDRSAWAEQGVLLSDRQQLAMAAIQGEFETKDAVLLHGVTGSGKTEIYIRIIEQILEEGRQVLYMLPEIALTAQIINRLQEHFGERVGLYHSRMSDNERVEVWKRQLSNEPYGVVLGARSALFLPFKNLGLAILDEEHEHTFKQHDPAPRYHSRDAVASLCKQEGAKLLLGSATPSIEAYYNGTRGRIGLVQLTERFGGVKMPHIEISDLRHERKERTVKGPFSSQLLQRISETVARRQQVIIFQNRRGFSSFVQCNNCGWVPDCINCDISLTYHKYSQDLRCHYCGHSDRVPHVCLKCQSTYIRTQGFGTEQVEEELSIHFPNSVVARMDLDTTRGKHAYQRIINDFEEQRIDILVGTQMVTKGLDFDHVGLVGVLNADSLLNYPDFRAFERAFQLMAQVSGRAGRKGKRGLVVVQTSEPTHFIIEKVVQNDYEGMYHSELVQRKQYRYPPFIRLIAITVKHRERDMVDRAADALAKALIPVPDKLLLGPEYPMVPRIRNQYNKQILIKLGGGDIALRKAQIFDIIQQIRQDRQFRSVHFQPDVDPV